MFETTVTDFANKVDALLDDDGSMVVFKVVRADRSALRGGFTYELSLNVDHVPFSVKKNGGGLYFVWRPESILRFVYFEILPSSHLIAICRLPKDARVAANFQTLLEAKADRLIVDAFLSQTDFFQHPRYFTLPSARITAARTNGIVIEKFAPEQLSPEVCLAAVSQCGYAIVFLSNEHRSVDVCLAAVTQDATAIRHLTNEQRSPQVCLAAVKECGYLIGDVDPAMRTPEMCLAAVKSAGRLFSL